MDPAQERIVFRQILENQLAVMAALSQLLPTANEAQSKLAAESDKTKDLLVSVRRS